MSIEGWAILELLGHRTRAGRVSEVEIAGTPMLRVDIPVEDGADTDFVTEYYGGAAVYSICPTAEDVIRDQRPGKRLPARPVQYRDEPQLRLERSIDGDDNGDEIPFEERSQDVHGTRFDARDEITAE